MCNGIWEEKKTNLEQLISVHETPLRGVVNEAAWIGTRRVFLFCLYFYDSKVLIFNNKNCSVHALPGRSETARGARAS